MRSRWDAHKEHSAAHRVVEGDDVASGLRHQAGVGALQRHAAERLLARMRLALVVADDLAERYLRALHDSVVALSDPDPVAGDQMCGRCHD